MNRITIATLGTLLALPVVAVEVDEVLDAASDGHVEISNIAGEVEVLGWDRNSVEVTGELGKNVEELVFERDDDRVTIKVKVPRKSSRNIASDLVIKVPERSSIDVGTVSADIDVEDVLGKLRLHTVSGDVAAESVSQNVSCESVSGDIDIDGTGTDAETRVASVSGDVTVFRINGEISLETVSGDLVVDEGAYDRVRAEAVNGDILFQSALRRGGRLEAETVNGDMNVEFIGDVSAEFEIDTFNGSINNCFGPEARRTSKYTPGWELSFVEGDGDGRVVMSTLNGDMRLCKK